MSKSAQATIKKHPRLGGLSNVNAFPPKSRDQKPEVKVPAWSTSGESIFPGMDGYFLIALSLGRERRKTASSLVSFSYKGTNPIIKTLFL